MTPKLPIDAMELREVALPLVRPFRTSFGEERQKRAILVRARGQDSDGWGECVAMETPRFSEEWLDGAWHALQEFLVPSVLERGPVEDPAQVGDRLAWARGHRMAKAAIEAAVADAWLRVDRRPLAAYLGGAADRVPCGVSVGIARSIEVLADEVRGYVAQGYRRVKLKIEPGWDVDVVGAIRKEFPDLPLSVDANAAYSPADLRVFQALDDLGLLMIEQPLHHEDLYRHAALQAKVRTPICLDESIRSAADAVAAIEIGACQVINIKPGRVGGLVEARRVHDEALARDVPVWIGGMLETGVGRAVNVALASLPGVRYPGDTSASDRYFAQDITAPFALASDGTMAVPDGPGIGVSPDPGLLEEFTVRTALVTG